MDEEKYNEEVNKLFKLYRTPDEFQTALKSMAWEIGHSYGYNEVLIHLEDFCCRMEDPIINFENRVEENSKKVLNGP